MNPVPDHELPDELPANFVGGKRLVQHLNYGGGRGGGIYRWYGADGRDWPIQEQYDTRKPKPATARVPAFAPARTGVVILDATQPTGFYGEVCSTWGQLREEWKRWRAAKKAAARCDQCDGLGDVFDLTGEWRGRCTCPAGALTRSDPQQEKPDA